MPIYLVRWERTRASLVGARDEDELRLILDEVDDPARARWSVYNGPLWVDVKLPVEPDSGASEEPAVDASAVVAQGERALQLAFGETEAGDAMREVIARWALPHLHEVVESMSLEAEHEPDAVRERCGARAPYWRERVARALAADEADMTALVQRRLADAVKRRGGAARVRQEELRAAVERLAETLVRGRRPSAPPTLALVRDADEDDAR